MKTEINMKGVVARLKQELGYRYDTELSEHLGKDPKYISVLKGRDTFGGEVWMQILSIAKEKDIDLNWLLYGELKKGVSAEKILNDTVKNNIRDKGKRNETVRRLSEAIVMHRSLNEGKHSDDLIDLANILIMKLMSEN